MSARVQRASEAASALARRCLPGLLVLAVATDGLAALGQAPSLAPPLVSLAPKPRQLAPNAAVREAAYTVHETRLETGTVVSEYADPSGQVFAVTWRGPVLPDLSQWLGDYFGAFKQETGQLRLAGRRGSPINMEQEGLVVRSNGRMRNFFGHAYVPALVPPTVQINDVLQ